MLLFKVKQEDMLSFYFNRSLRLEDILLKKNEQYKKLAKDQIIRDLMDDFRKNSNEHIKTLNDRMKKLGIQ